MTEVTWHAHIYLRTTEKVQTPLGPVKSSQLRTVVLVKIWKVCQNIFPYKRICISIWNGFSCHLWFTTLHNSLLSVIKSKCLSLASWRRRKWQPTPIFLPRESHGQRSLVGCSPRGRTELDTTEATWQQQQHLEPWSSPPDPVLFP